MTGQAIQHHGKSAKDDVPVMAAHGLSGREAVAAAFALAAEAFVVLLAFSADVPFIWVLVAHVITAASACAILFVGRTDAYDPTVSQLIFLVILVCGPAGAAAALAALAFVDHAGAGPDVLDDWYDRLARASHALPSSELSERVSAGRVMRGEASAPVDFEDVIASGTLAERQAALGLMARRFHTDFAPALQAALRSDEPVVRVQAAAVVARVRADLKTRIKELLAGRDGVAAAARLREAAELSRLAACSLVDRADADRCRKAATEILQVAMPTGHDVRSVARSANRETATMIERFLLAAGRHGEFRVARRIHALVAGRGMRVRPLPRGAAP